MKKSILFFATTLLTASMSYAGGFISGGGGVSRGAWNPWFLETAGDISYCIERDPQHFSVSEDKLNELIQKSRDYWDKEFSSQSYPSFMGSDFPSIAKNRFVKTVCGPEVDLHFAFGVVPDLMKSEVKDPTEFFGLALRTQYDKVQLKGKGIIYIAPTSGPLKPNGPNIHPDAWLLKDHFILQMALIHELGHVYGIQDLPGEASMMWSRLLEALTNRETIENLETVSSFPTEMSFFEFGNSQKSSPFCSSSSSSSSSNTSSTSLSSEESDELVLSPFEIYFGINSNNYCFDVERNGNTLLIYQNGFQEDPSPRRRLGQAEVKFSETWSSAQEAVSIYLHPEQTVVPEFSKEGPLLILRHRMAQTHFSGHFTSEDGQKKQIFGSVTPEGNFVFGGIVDGRIYANLDDFDHDEGEEEESN